MEIQILGAHNLESVETKLVSILVDDVLALDAGSLTSSLPFAAQQRIKAILITHHHFDHVRDILPLGLATGYLGTTKLYCTATAAEILGSHLLDGTLYPDLTRWPSPQSPAFRFHILETHTPQTIEGYSVVALPVHHAVAAVGYQVAQGGRSFFYTGDTGSGLASCWPHTSPQLLITEVTGPDRLEEVLRAGHLTPQALRQELVEFQKLKGYLPAVVLVHFNSQLESEIKEEVERVSRELATPISLAYDGMKIRL